MKPKDNKSPAAKSDDESHGAVLLPLYRMKALPFPFRPSPDDVKKAT